MPEMRYFVASFVVLNSNYLDIASDYYQLVISITNWSN